MYFETVQKIREKKIIAIIRGIEVKDAIESVKALMDGGISNIEVAANTPNAIEIIKMIADEFGDEINLGAGTVLDIATAQRVIEAGCKFVLSPVYSDDVLKIANQYDVLYIPGVFTPNEIAMAWEKGVKIQKIFPVTSLAKTFVKDVKNTISNVELIPVGGVTLENIKEHFENKAFAVGVGGNLISDKIVKQHGFKYISEMARKYVEIVENI